jgi:hypothetical protein
MIGLLINLLIVLYTLVFFEVLGNYIGKKIFNQNMIFNIPLGFLLYMVIFEILMLIPMVLHMSYNLVLFGMFPATIILSLFVFIKHGKETLIDFKENIKTNFVKTVYLIGIVFSTYVAVMAVSLGDGWLFSSMIMSSIQNGVIFSHNGIEVMGEIQSLHYTDGYYLFQSMLASLSLIDPFVFVMTYMKFIESMIIIMMLALLSNIVFKKHRTSVYILQVLSIFLVINLFTIYVNTNEINIHLLKTVPIGTSMLNNLVLIYLFIYFYIRDINTKHGLFLFLITMGGFAFTASTMFLVVPFVFMLAAMDVLYYKNTTYIKYYIIPVYVVLMFIGNYLLLNKQLYLMFGVYEFILLVLFIAVFKLLKKARHKLIELLIKGIFILYICFLFFGWLYLNSTYDIFTNFLNLSHTDTYRIYPHYYTDYTSSIFILVLTILGLIKLYKHDKKIFVYVIFAALMFANIIAYRTVGIFINKAVYHRLSNILMINVIVITGTVYLFEILSNKVKIKINYLFAACFMLFFITHQPVVRNDMFTYDSFEEYKFVDPNLYTLYNYEFKESNDVSLGTNASPAPNLSQNIDHLFRVRADLDWITTCTEDCYWLIKNEEQVPEGGTVALQTEDYKLIYIGEKNE